MLISVERKELVKMLEEHGASEALEFAKELRDSGMFTEATEDEIERFMKIV